MAACPSAPAADALASLGLALFIAAVAIGAGGTLIEVLKTFGLSLILAGATCGAMTSGAAIGEVIKDSKSFVPAIAFALPSSLNNVIYTIVVLVVMKLV